LMRMWWQRRQRAIDMDLLWPACCADAPDLDAAKKAFAEHAMRDPAWQALGEHEVIRFIDQLEAYR
jgi:hypothetical protein